MSKQSINLDAVMGKIFEIQTCKYVDNSIPCHIRFISFQISPFLFFKSISLSRYSKSNSEKAIEKCAKGRDKLQIHKLWEVSQPIDYLFLFFFSKLKSNKQLRC